MSEPNVKFVGNKRVVWGTNGTFTEGVLVDSASNQQTADNEEIKDNDGNVVAKVFFNFRKQTSASCICGADDTIPAIGDIVEICGYKCIAEDVKEDWSKGASKKFSITATKYEQLATE